MPLYQRKMLILAKGEITEQVDPTPTPGANAILAVNATLTPMVAQQADRKLVRPYMGAQPQLMYGLSASLEFDVEMQGSGAATTPAGYAVLMKASGLSETIGASDCQYDPVSASFGSATLYFYMDAIKHAMTGCRGSKGWKVEAGILYWHYKINGIYVDPADASPATPDFTAFKTPLVSSAVNTPTFTLHGYAAKLQSFSGDMNNAIDPRILVNSMNVPISDRAVKGSVTIEMPSVATKDFFGIAKAGTTGALSFVHGTAAGSICKISGPAVQIQNPKYAEDKGVVMLQADLVFCPSTGNDEIKFTTA